MRSKMRHPLPLTILLLLAAAFTGECSASGTPPPPGPTITLQGVQDDLYRAELQIEATEDALNELAVSAGLDLQQAFTTFAEQAKRMREAGESLVAHADGMHFYGASYLLQSAGSASSCPYPVLAREANQHTAEMGAYYEVISQEAWEVKRAYRAYAFDLEQLSDYLYRNLNPAAVDNMSKIIAKAEIDSESLDDALQRAQGAIDTAKAAGFESNSQAAAKVQ